MQFPSFRRADAGIARDLPVVNFLPQRAYAEMAKDPPIMKFPIRQPDIIPRPVGAGGLALVMEGGWAVLYGGIPRDQGQIRMTTVGKEVGSTTLYGVMSGEFDAGGKLMVIVQYPSPSYTTFIQGVDLTRNEWSNFIALGG